MKLDELMSQWEARGLKRGRTLLLQASEAMEMIAAARSSKIRVLGVDSFRITDLTTEPQDDDTLDLSTATNQDDSWKLAAEFIQQRAKLNLFFEVTMKDSAG